MITTALPPLTEKEKQQVAANIELVRSIHPEMADSIKALRAAGFDIGWRNVAYVGPHRPEPENSITTADMVLESAADTKKRMGLHEHR